MAEPASARSIATAEQLIATAEQQRNVRAEIIAAVTAGELSFQQVIERARTEPLVAKIKLLPVVVALPSMGKVTSRRLLSSLDVPEGCRLGEVTNLSQRAELIARLASSARLTSTARLTSSAAPSHPTS